MRERLDVAIVLMCCERSSATFCEVRAASTQSSTRSAGNHVLRLGGFNNQKTLNNESTELLIDDVLLTAE